jgi:pyruvate/2-oxoglutarate dehydrogenase complex dihydrolipoamide dehydrogenase (E3) component
VGDVIDRVALTPVALAEAMVVVARLFGKGERRDVLPEHSHSRVQSSQCGHRGTDRRTGAKDLGE